jgi:hypothetical protein
MNRKNWQMSMDKWTPLHELFNKPGRVDWAGWVYAQLRKRCGHCEEYEYFKKGERVCAKCSLNDKNLCCSGAGAFDDFFKMLNNDIPRSKRKARTIVNRIYNQIVKDEVLVCE